MERSDTLILAAVIADLRRRELKGLETYGTTMDRTDLSHEEWLNHLYEEVLDSALYLKKIINPGLHLLGAIDAVDQGMVRFLHALSQQDPDRTLEIAIDLAEKTGCDLKAIITHLDLVICTLFMPRY